ncbi:PIN domain-containing protein [Brachyspira intermedia]|uniref:PIN domain-containing protein n=1 Tax=Brachyspira intermedia TaxID=84377 RepID=UPI0030069A9B
MYKTNNNRNKLLYKNDKIDVKKLFFNIGAVGTVINVLGKIFTTSKSAVDEIKNQGGILYVFDTNALMNIPNLITTSKINSSYVLPIVVLEELNKLKLYKNRSQKVSNTIRAINKLNVIIENTSNMFYQKILI